MMYKQTSTHSTYSDFASRCEPVTKQSASSQLYEYIYNHYRTTITPYHHHKYRIGTSTITSPSFLEA
eukprot:scaffold540552_cov18-Prasinocladus_malaysianus.AAC.1